MANDNINDRIVPLDELSDFKVADDDPDVRGWDVLSADGRRIGEVENLLVDRTAMKVRYLDVEVDDDLVQQDRERHVLIPIGYARLDRDDSRIMVDSLNSSDIGALPAYAHEPITRDYENSLRTSWDRNYTSGGRADTDFYDDALFDDRRFYDSQRENPLA
jgi:photosynthetic reaction center H subunit